MRRCWHVRRPCQTLANDPRARALTQAHKALQVAIGGTYSSQALALWALLDFDHLGATSERWMLETFALVQEGYAVSADQAAQYLSEYRLAAAGIRDAPIVKPGMGTSHVADALYNIVDDMQSLIEVGYPIDAVSEIGLARMEGYVQRAVLNGGRNASQASAYAASRPGRPVGWLRVSDGEPCAFCAMLVGRGPVYKVDTVRFRAHGYCGCTAEEFYGEWKDWEPTGLEAKWRDSYFQAAEIATSVDGRRVAPKPGAPEDTILWRMRRNAPDLFSDGVYVPA